MAGQPQTWGPGVVVPLVDAPVITVDLAQPAFAANAFSVTLAGNRTINFLNPSPGERLELIVTQDGTGGRTLAVQTNGVAALVSGAPLLSVAVGAVDRVTVDTSALLTLGKALASATKAFA